MSVEWFDLGQRFRAAASGQAVPRLLHAAQLPGQRPVAVRAGQRGETLRVTAATPDDAGGSAEGLAGLDLLAGLGVSMDAATPATLVTEGPGTLRALLGLARQVAPGSEVDATAAHIGWWADRADFPVGVAVADVLGGCRARWVTGEAPAAESEVGLWRRWLGVLDSSVGGLLDLHRLVSDGPPLPWLDALAADDRYTYDRARKAHSDGWDWRRPDTASRAAVGLRSRCDAADLYAGALLADPLWRVRCVHSGEVVVGEVVADAPSGLRTVEVRCDRLDARLRADNDVLWWAGQPADSVAPGGGWAGTVRASSVRSGSLVLSLSTTATRPPVAGGARVTLMPGAPSVNRQRFGQRSYRQLQYSRRSWLTQGRTPTPTRRTVPLDVLLAGADDD